MSTSKGYWFKYARPQAPFDVERAARFAQSVTAEANLMLGPNAQKPQRKARRLDG